MTDSHLRSAARLPVRITAAIARFHSSQHRDSEGLRSARQVREQLCRRIALIVRTALIYMLDVVAVRVPDERVEPADGSLPFGRPHPGIALRRKPWPNRMRFTAAF